MALNVLPCLSTYLSCDNQDMAANIASSSVENITHSKMPRVGFKKSRNGCFACKRRKIKCQEMRPQPCHNCSRIQTECIYPVLKRNYQAEPASTITSIVHLSGRPTTFSPTDLRLFHHFICNAYPHLPLGNDQVWVTDIASYSHSYDFLIHALLGMAASHLSLTSNANLHTLALSHRLIAVKGLNEALSHTPQTQADGDALIAACYALALQSSYMGSSVSEFLTMLRGKNLIVTQEWVARRGTAFTTLSHASQLAIASDRLASAPVLDANAVKLGKASLQKLLALCNDAVLVKVGGYLLEVFNACEISSREAYFKFWDLGTNLSTLPQHEFQMLLDPCDHIMQLLLAHHVGISVLMYPVKAMEWQGRNLGKPNRTTVYALDEIVDSIPSELRNYLEWPQWMIGIR